jgi:lysozyme
LRTPLRAALRRILTRRLTTRLIAGTAAAASLVAGTVAYAGPTGIDVSRWQHGTAINWSKVQGDGVTFVFVKATEGAYYVNPYHDGDRAAARSRGIYQSAYHYARPSAGSAGRQARYFVRHAGPFDRRGDLPPVLDLEDDGGLSDAALQTWTRTWLRTAEELTGRKPIIYTGPYFWESEMGDTREFASFPLWVAHYQTSSPRVPGGWRSWTFWQRSQTGRVNGISGAVDINKFNGTSARLSALALNGRTGGDDDPGTGTTPPPENDGVDGGTPGMEEPDPAKPATALSLELSRDAVYPGRTVDFTGDLETSTGEGLAYRTLALLRRAAGSSTWTRISTPNTDAQGHFSVSFAASSSADFRFRYAGATDHAGAVSAMRRLTVRTQVRTRPTLKVDYRSRQGRAVKIYGHLRTAAGKALPGKTMYLFQRPAGTSRWTLVSQTSTLSPTGWYQAYVQPRRTTTYKAVFRGGFAFARGVSDLTTVRAR